MKSSCLRFALIIAVLASFSLIGTAAANGQEASLALMPQPSHMVKGEGQFPINGDLRIDLKGYKDARISSGKQRFLEVLYRETGIPLLPESDARPARFVIRTLGPSAPVLRIGEDESYRLEVTTDHVLLTAPNPLGILHGLQTFLQLVRLTPQGFSVPAVTIDDQPRFQWRGLMIDSSRHFMPVSVITRNLDGMEAVKMNVFHWHLSDDQGFRVESKVFPLLQGKGSGRSFYSQKQIGEVIEYARQRGIRVVPEFDMPCHTTSWFPGYPRLASGKGPYQIRTRWGIQDAAIDPTRETTYQFLDQLHWRDGGVVS